MKKKQAECSVYEQIVSLAETILDAELKKHVRVKGISQDTLVFLSDSSAAAFTVKLHKEKLLRDISKAFPEIKNIQIKTGTV